MPSKAVFRYERKKLEQKRQHEAEMRQTLGIDAIQRELDELRQEIIKLKSYLEGKEE